MFGVNNNKWVVSIYSSLVIWSSSNIKMQIFLTTSMICCKVSPNLTVTALDSLITGLSGRQGCQISLVFCSKQPIGLYIVTRASDVCFGDWGSLGMVEIFQSGVHEGQIFYSCTMYVVSTPIFLCTKGIIWPCSLLL